MVTATCSVNPTVFYATPFVGTLPWALCCICGWEERIG